MEIRNNKGVTLIALMITVIVLIIIASIAFNSGKKTIQEAQLEGLKTNMLLIEAKAKEYVEEANFKMGVNPDDTKKAQVIQEVYIDKAKLEIATSAELNIPEIGGVDLSKCYAVDREALDIMGLSKVELEEGEYYLIEFNEIEAKVEEIYNTIGYRGVYSLSGLETIE